MSMDTIIKLVLVTGIVLIVFAIGIRARIENPLLLVRKPALALRAMVAMFVLLPLFALMVTRLLPLQQGVGAALLGVAVSPMLPPWAKTGSKVGAKGTLLAIMAILGTVLLYLIASIATTVPHQPWRVKVLALADVAAVYPTTRSGGPRVAHKARDLPIGSRSA